MHFSALYVNMKVKKIEKKNKSPKPLERQLLLQELHKWNVTSGVAITKQFTLLESLIHKNWKKKISKVLISWKKIYVLIYFISIFRNSFVSSNIRFAFSFIKSVNIDVWNLQFFFPMIMNRESKKKSQKWKKKGRKENMSPGTININEMLPTVAMIQQNSQRSLLESSIQHLKKNWEKTSWQKT